MCDACVSEFDYRTRASISPPSFEAFRRFLEEFEGATAVLIEYTDEDGSHERLVADLQVIERTVQRPAAAISLACRPAPPDEDEWTVRFDSIDFVSVLETPIDSTSPGSVETPGNVGSYLNLARVAPGEIDVDGLVTVLQAEDYDGRESGLSALRSAANVTPEDCTVALPLLRDLLVQGDHETKVLEIFATIAEERPADIASFVEAVAAYLSADDPEHRAAAAACASSVATHDPADVVDAVPALSSMVEDRDEGMDEALFALNRIADEYPAAVRPAAATLGDAVSDSSLSDGDRLNATSGLGRVVGEYPDAGLEAVEYLCDLLEADDHRLRANSAAVLGDVATVHAGVLVPHVDDLAPLLESDDDYALVNTTAGLSRIAETAPGAVEGLTDRFVDLLEHEHDLVRLNACWALGHMEADVPADVLREVSQDDDDDRVRNRAAWAVSEIEGWKYDG